MGRRMYRFGAAVVMAAGALAFMASSSDATLTTPGAPTSLTVVLGRAVGEVKLTWTAPVDTGGGIASYAVSTAVVTGGVTGTWSSPQTTGSTATRSNRICTATYPDVCRYRVYARNSAGTSAASNEVQMAWSAPSAARSARAVPLTLHDFTANDITWLAPASTGGLPVTYDVQIRVDGGAWTNVATDLAVRSLSDDANCTGGTSCLYRVRAKNAVGFGPNSNSSALAVRPTAVTDLAVSVTGTDPTMGNPTSGGTEATVTWALPRAGLVDDDYEVAGCLNVCTASSGTWTSPVPVAGLSTVVPCGAEYRTCTYRVRATNSLGGVGAWSYRAISPFGPSVVSAATGSDVDEIAVTFYGVAESGLGLPADKYFQFLVCTASCGTAANWAADEAENVTLSSIVNYPATATVACPGGTSCQVRAQFVDGEGNESPLSPVTAATGAALPGDPTGLSVLTGTTSGTVDATWTAPADLGTPALTQYQTRYSTDAGSTFTAWSNTGSTATSRTITCGAGATCDVEVRSVNAIGTSDAATDSAVAAEVPGTPENVVADTGTTSGTVDVTWDAPADLGTPALTQYQTRYSTDAGSSFTAWSNTGSTATSRTITCGAGATCLVEVRAVNAIGTGVSASDSAVAADVPAQLTGFSAAYSSGDAVLAWTLGASYPAITDIEYQVSTDGGTTWGSWTSLATTGTGATVSACSSTSDDTCEYRVRAVNLIGNGAASASDGFTIP
ncbi:MAG: hypothetical protein ACKOZL_04375 [Actinomycetes bacterium]